MADVRERGRQAFERRAWSSARAALRAAEADAPLDIDDLERLAVATYLVGDDDAATELWTRAHHLCLRADDVARAARCAFWLAFGLDVRGQHARAGGWLTRARRLAEAAGPDCAEQGYVLVPEGLERLLSGDAAGALTAFQRVTDLGERCGDRDLVTLGTVGRGQALIAQGDRAAGAALLDEAMVAVTADEVSPLAAGLVYCAVIETCHEMLDLRRAGEWTDALARWCASQPDLVPYRGQCLVHRAQIMRWHGDWPAAMTEVERAYQWLSQPPGQPAIGAACYERAELHRLRGQLAEADDAYRQASHWGRTPHPGLALLRLAQGRVDAAGAAIRRALAEPSILLLRAPLLATAVEVALAEGDLAAARAAADELSAIGVDRPMLQAMAAQATGAVLLADGQPDRALAALRRAWTAWHEVGAPYERAQVRVLVGRACLALGDRDTARLELDAAAQEFERLGAGPDVAGVRALVADVSEGDAAPGGLSRRELEVLALVATGRTNRAIAAELAISQKTVARHVSNIFTKLGLSSRSAATAYAYEHGLA